uniref:G domain-containing protein n=1 Tax=Erpetoichthys calabaricus TaxID=27687 RepID=A0A8C4SZZ0_ERPCA
MLTIKLYLMGRTAKLDSKEKRKHRPSLVFIMFELCFCKLFSNCFMMVCSPMGSLSLCSFYSMPLGNIILVFLWIVSFSFCFFSFVTSRVKNELLQDIRNYEILTESVEEPRILLIGQIGSGKSSFFNSVNSVFRGHVMQQAGSGHGVNSISTRYRTYKVLNGKGEKMLPFVLCDTMGLEREENREGIHMGDIINVIKGHVPDMYEFNPKAPITEYDVRYRHEPSLGDKVHCVVFVIDADKMSLINNILQQNSLFYSLFFQVTQLGQILGVPVSAISLVKNYSEETELNQNVDILILRALQQMLRAADACLDEMKLQEPH